MTASLSAGVSAGIDMAFDLVERLCSKTVADETARYIEYPRSPSDRTGSTLLPSLVTTHDNSGARPGRKLRPTSCSTPHTAACATAPPSPNARWLQNRRPSPLSAFDSALPDCGRTPQDILEQLDRLGSPATVTMSGGR